MNIAKDVTELIGIRTLNLAAAAGRVSLHREHAIGLPEPRHRRMRRQGCCEAREHGTVLQRQRQVPPNPESPSATPFVPLRIGYSMINAAEQEGKIKPGVV